MVLDRLLTVTDGLFAVCILILTGLDGIILATYLKRIVTDCERFKRETDTQSWNN